MTMRLLSEADVRRLLDPDRAIRESVEAFRALSEGKVEVPLRAEIHRPDVGGVILVMPGLIRDSAFGLKIIANRTDAATGAFETTSMVLLFDATTLQPLGLLSSDYFTDYRTAAGLAAATDALARPDARVMAVYGAGKLAEPSIRLIARVRPLDRLLIVGRTPARVQALMAALRADPPPGVGAIEDGVGADEAAAAADIVTTVTTAETAVFDGRRLRAGTHVNLGGAFKRANREIDDAVAARAVYYVDSLTSCLERSGDVCLALESGALSRDRLRGEIGQLFAGTIPGRQSADEITVFKSLGNAAQDLALGAALLRRADGAGLTFDHLGSNETA